MLKMILIFLTSVCVPFISGCSDYGCDFNFVSYKPGNILTFPCFNFDCYLYPYGYDWRLFQIFDCFSYACKVCNGMNIKTFDSHYYTWRGSCNYTLSQPIDCKDDCRTYNPFFGVFSDFKTYYSFPWFVHSRLDSTTYKVTPNTVVSIDHSNPQNINIMVNGNSIALSNTPGIIYSPNGSPYPILAWRVWWWWWWNCVFIIGPDYTILACPNCLYIWTHWWNAYDVSGLCGYFTYYEPDDFLTRECITEPFSDVADFALSWMTLQQKNDGCCPKREIYSYYMMTKKCDVTEYHSSSCSYAVNSVSKAYGYHYNLNDTENIIDVCTDNCCRYPENCDSEWTVSAREMAELEFNISAYLQEKFVKQSEYEQQATEL